MKWQAKNSTGEIFYAYTESKMKPADSKHESM
jgi:hypothetical protein